MFPVGPTSCVSSNCLEHKIWGYKPIYLARGRKRTNHTLEQLTWDGYKPIYLARGRKRIINPFIILSSADINLYTSRGDGNKLWESYIKLVLWFDINLYTSRGDGNFCVIKCHRTPPLNWYKPIYLERGRKPICWFSWPKKSFGYKPIYLERGRKPNSRLSSSPFLKPDINLYTSRGDGNSACNKLRFDLLTRI